MGPCRSPQTRASRNAWDAGTPFGALDFAPPGEALGCVESNNWVTAAAGGLVTRTGKGVVVLDLDHDGDERTGWNILYLHVATSGRASVGRRLKAGDPVGYPSCERGTATGTHIHIARKYNGEWIPVDSAIVFNLDGWIAQIGDAPYEGTLRRGNQTVTACECSDAASQVKAGK